MSPTFDRRLNPTRRQWLAGLCAASAASRSPLAGAGKRPPAFGAQLYTVRSLLRRAPDRALQALAAIGFRDVEGHSRPELLALLPKIKQYGLTARSCYIETPLITKDWELYPDLKPVSLPEAIGGMADAGIEYFTMDYISPGARGDGDDFYRRTADRMNVAAEMCRKAGMKFAYRTHAFEFGGRAGLRPMDIFQERLDAKLVGYELDVFWASVAGIDPVELLKIWKGRVPMLHLQDLAKETPRMYQETLGPGAFLEAGSGALNFPAILKVAQAAGVKYYFVEQDETGGDPIESLRKSFEYLKGL
ncbi:MAG: sugar phosphate isomerase/epimerase [Bryobacteraceae bacterium]